MKDWFIDLLKTYEGFRSNAYWDVDHYSIGYGSDTMPDGTPVTKDSTITKQQAEQLIPAYIAKKEKYIRQYFPNYDSFPEQTKYALIDQLYRGGQGAFGKSPKFVKALNDAYEDGVMTKEEAAKVLEQLDIPHTKGSVVDRKQRRAALLMGVYNPEHNKSAYAKHSPYRTFYQDYNNPNTMWGQVVQNTYRDQNFVTRLQDPNRERLTLDNNSYGTHKLGYVTGDNYDVIFPAIQQKTSQFLWFKPTYTKGLEELPPEEAYKKAVQMGDTIQVPSGMGEVFTKNYKKYYPGFNQKGGVINYLDLFNYNGK